MKVLLGTVCICVLWVMPTEVAMGSQYKDRILPSLAGEPRSLGEFRGQKILLVDFASW